MTLPANVTLGELRALYEKKYGERICEPAFVWLRKELNCMTLAELHPFCPFASWEIEIGKLLGVKQEPWKTAAYDALTRAFKHYLVAALTCSEDHSTAYRVFCYPEIFCDDDIRYLREKLDTLTEGYHRCDIQARLMNHVIEACWMAKYKRYFDVLDRVQAIAQLCAGGSKEAARLVEDMLQMQDILETLPDIANIQYAKEDSL